MSDKRDDVMLDPSVFTRLTVGLYEGDVAVIVEARESLGLACVLKNGKWTRLGNPQRVDILIGTATVQPMETGKAPAQKPEGDES